MSTGFVNKLPVCEQREHSTTGQFLPEGIRHGSIRTSQDIKLTEFHSIEDVKPVFGNTNTETSPLFPCVSRK